MPLMIGSQAGGVVGMVDVSTLEPLARTRTKAWEVTPVHYSIYIRNGDGKIIGQGFRQCEWHLNGIRDVTWAALRTLATSQSTYVYIQTYKEDGKTFGNYLALMHFPEAPPTRDHDTNVVLDFTLTFTEMIEQ
jgi:hypothetical protein